MRNKAFTLTELTISIVIITILTAASISVTKNLNSDKRKMFIYSSIQSLTRGNIAIAEKFDYFYPNVAKEYDEDAAKTNDWYCLQLSDLFSLNTNPNCSKSAASNVINFKFSNGVAFMGLAQPWQNLYDDLYYKNILVDIDGEDGLNKIGVDRFPLRIFRGQNAMSVNADGLIYPIDCGDDYLYDAEDNKLTPINTYCGANTNKMASDGQIYSYGIYRVIDSNTPNSADLISSMHGAIEADCLSHGAYGFYGAKVCESKNIDIHQRCAHVEICKNCEADGTCPNSSNEANCNTLAQNNELLIADEADPTGATTVSTGFRCLTLIAKPKLGLGFMSGAIMDGLGI